MTDNYEHGGTCTNSNGIVHNFGYGLSVKLAKCGTPVDGVVHSDGIPDDVTCPGCIATFPEWLLTCINDPLVKTKGGYYVHWSYLRYEDSGEPCAEEHEEHSAATSPSYYYDKKHKKWALAFSGADFGGYDVQNFVFYFDSEEEILKYLTRGGKNGSI